MKFTKYNSFQIYKDVVGNLVFYRIKCVHTDVTMYCF